jgi:hypothetical protein
MSRSYRKPVVTEGYGGKSRRHAKRLANNCVKRADVSNGAAYKRVFNAWDICDFKFYIEKTSSHYRKARRK